MAKRITRGLVAGLALLLLWQGLAFSAYAEKADNPSMGRLQNDTGGTASVPENVTGALSRALDYLESSVADPGVSSIGGEWSVLALARNNRMTQSLKDAYMHNLSERLEETQGVLSTRKYTEYSRVVRVLSALGCNPADVNGYNLLAPLEDFDAVCTQGINGPAWALMAMDSGNYEFSAEKDGCTSRQKLIDYLLEHQLPGGGWGLSDSVDDMTPMILQALAPYYKEREDVRQAVDTAVMLLSQMQDDEGGFGKAGGSESVSQVIIALAALDKAYFEDSMFIKNGNSVVDALLRYQNEDGSFRHVLSGSADSMATDQAVLALTTYSCAQEGKNPLYGRINTPANPQLSEPLANNAEKEEPAAQPESGSKAGIAALLGIAFVCGAMGGIYVYRGRKKENPHERAAEKNPKLRH